MPTGLWGGLENKYVSNVSDVFVLKRYFKIPLEQMVSKEGTCASE